MNKFGFVRATACAPKLSVADVFYNMRNIIGCVNEAKRMGSKIILFPELSITGYTCGDLFQQEKLLVESKRCLQAIATHSEGCVIVVGLPLEHDSRLFNVAAICANGKVVAYVPKSYLPSYKEYYEDRWFHSGLGLETTIDGVPFCANSVFDFDFNGEKFSFGVEICEDVWMPLPPSTLLSLEGATLILNLSASTETIGKADYRRELVAQNSGRNVVNYLYAASGPSESTSDVVFSGHCMAAEYGSMLIESPLYERNGIIITTDFDMEKIKNERRKLTTFGDQVEAYRSGFFGRHKAIHIGINLFGTDAGKHEFLRNIDAHPFVPKNPDTLNKRAKEIFDIQTNALITRLEKRRGKVVIGISGGLDSTLALLVAVKAFDMMKLPRTDIIGITMPGFGTTDKTKTNAEQLMEILGITSLKIPIKLACIQHFKDIGLDPGDRSITYENVQARERTQILMDYANKVGGMVLGTGDLSELALGWCTYNGDHMSMYSVNCSVPKTLVKFLVEWVAVQHEFSAAFRTLKDICNTTISPELLPPDEKGEIKQSTEAAVGPYELHDFFLYNMVRWNYSREKIEFLAGVAFEGRYSMGTIRKWLSTFYERFFAAQFKRDCVPNGPKVGSISLSPRGDWRMPSDASVEVWRM